MDNFCFQSNESRGCCFQDEEFWQHCVKLHAGRQFVLWLGRTWGQKGHPKAEGRSILPVSQVSSPPWAPPETCHCHQLQGCPTGLELSMGAAHVRGTEGVQAPTAPLRAHTAGNKENEHE